MNTATDVHSDTDPLMKALGYLLLNWSMLERAVIDDIKRLRLSDGDSGMTTARARGSFNERLAEWRALVSLKSRRNPEAAREVAEIGNLAEQLCRTRNLISHHFVGVERTTDCTSVIYASESGIASLRASQTAFSLEQLDGLNAQMCIVCERIAGLKSILAS